MLQSRPLRGRRIEAATHQHLSVRYLAGNTHPDHDTICKFRRENFEAITGCFLRVLELAKKLGLLRVGTVAIYGTRLRADASKHRSCSEPPGRHSLCSHPQTCPCRLSAQAAPPSAVADLGVVRRFAH